MASGVGTVVVNIIGKADQLKKSLDSADKDLGGFSNKLDSFGKTTMATGAKFTAGLTLPIVGGFALATKAAAEDEAAQARLAKTLLNTVGASDAVVAGVEGQMAAMMKVSTFADDDLRPAYEKLVSETRNVKEATDLMQTAMDLAAAKGISVEEASGLLVKAHNGQTRALKDLGVETKNAEGKAASFGDIMRDVNGVVGGQAVAATETAAGKTKMLQRDMGELVETLGVALVPVMEKVVGWISTLTEKFSNLSPVQQNIILGIGAAAAAIGPLTTAVGGLSVALGFLWANPIAAVIGALALMTLAIIAAKNEWIVFPDPIIFALNGLMFHFRWTIVEPILIMFDEILTGARIAFGWVPGVGGKIREAEDAFDRFAMSARGALSPIPLAAERTAEALRMIRDEALRVEGALDRLRDAGAVIGVSMGTTVSRSTYTGRAAGGPVTAGTPYVVGEDGPEMFIPNTSGRIVPGSTSSGTGTGSTNNYSIAVTAIDPAAASEAVITAIKEYERRNGTDWRVA